MRLVQEGRIPAAAYTRYSLALPDSPELSFRLWAASKTVSVSFCTASRARTPVRSLKAVGLAWAVILGFVRITTHPSMFSRPLDARGACGIVRAWLGRPQTRILHPGDRHAEIVFSLLESIGTAGNLATDAHLAALAIEHRAELH